MSLRYGGVLAVVLWVTLAAVGTAGSVPADSSAQPVTEVDSCTTITEPGVYVLVDDLKDVKSVRLSESCITIRADDVVFRGRGHVIDGKGISDTRGVTVVGSVGARDVTVRNVTVTDWNVGVYYQNVSGGEIQTVTARENAYGINLDATRDVSIRDNVASSNLIGIDLKGTDGSNTLSNNTVDGNFVTDVNDPTNATNATDDGSRESWHRTSWLR